MYTSGVNRFSNITQITESNFNITPPNVQIWTGDIPYKPGDTFPTEAIKSRANEYLTNKMLYKNRYGGILDNVFSWTDYMQNPITNARNLAICADLPDWFTTTEAWVSIFSNKPSINTVIDAEDDRFSGISNKIRKLSSVISNSNFGDTWLDIIRTSQIVYGNKAVKVSKTADGGVRLDNMALKCWEPFVNADNTGVIECNLFFNIFKDNTLNRDVCEFIAYVEDGTIIKKVYDYNGDRLGEQIGETEVGKAFDGKVNISPIVIFRGTSIDGDVFGESMYKYWDASISSAIRNYETIGVLVEQAKEIIRLLPAGATRTDDYTGITYNNTTGAIMYTDLDKIPTVEYKKVSTELDKVIEAYKESLARISRDTGLPNSFFDTRELHFAISGTAIKSSMYRTRTYANIFIGNVVLQLKQLIKRMAICGDIDIEDNVYDVTIDISDLVVDDMVKSNIIQARLNGSTPTMSMAEAIKEYDNVSIDVAVRKAQMLQGVAVDNKADDSITSDNGTGDNETTDNIEFTPSPNTIDASTGQMVEYPMGVLP